MGVQQQQQQRRRRRQQQQNSEDSKCNYFRTSPTYIPTVHERHKQTDGRTDDLR